MRRTRVRLVALAAIAVLMLLALTQVSWARCVTAGANGMGQTICNLP
jgi:hypothetical protein